MQYMCARCTYQRLIGQVSLSFAPKIHNINAIIGHETPHGHHVGKLLNIPILSHSGCLAMKALGSALSSGEESFVYYGDRPL